MKKILASMLSAAIVSAMLLTGCGSSGSAPAADASAAGSTPAADNTGGTATDYPTKQISMIIQASPGGLSDTNARAIAQLVQEDLGVPVVCTNKPGASGAVAMSFLQASKPDGYTIG